MWKTVLATVFVFLPALAFAQAGKTAVLSAIEVRGNQRTGTDVILRELRLLPDRSYANDEVEERIADLRNTGLFSEVKYSLQDDGDRAGRQRLIVEVRERWTTIPIFKLSSGGGVRQVIVGVYDPNLFGRYIEAGAQVERLEQATSGVVWLKNPGLFGARRGIDVQYWNIKRVRTKYDQAAVSPVVVNGFLQERERFYLAFDRTLAKNLRARLFYDYADDAFSDRFLAEDVRAISAAKGLPAASKVDTIGLGLELGRVDVSNHLVDGSLWTLASRASWPRTGQSFFHQHDFGFNYYRTVRGATLAQRISAGGTTTELLQYWNYLGGLDRIRGFSDDRFVGRYYWLTNSEARVPVLAKPSYVLQAVAFLDATSAKEQVGQLGEISGVGVGMGARLTIPKFYRLVLRVDAAKTLIKKDDMAFSFGLQQFF